MSIYLECITCFKIFDFNHTMSDNISNNKNPKSAENEELKNDVSWTPSHDISMGEVKTILGKQVTSRI